MGELQDLSVWQVDMVVIVFPSLFFQDSHLYKVFKWVFDSEYLRCIAMSSLRNIFPVRVYSFTSPASFVSLFQSQFWADSQFRVVIVTILAT